MSNWQLNALLVLLFVLLSGYFSASEIALVSLGDAQVRWLAERGRRGRALARMREDPSQFLSAVQISVTSRDSSPPAMAGPRSRSSSVGCSSASGCLRAVASTAALVLVRVAASYVSLVLGELARSGWRCNGPKRWPS